MPQSVSERLLSAFGGAITEVGTSGAVTYLGHHQGVIQIELGDNIIGRAALPTSSPIPTPRCICRRRDQGAGAPNGDCLFIPRASPPKAPSASRLRIRGGVSVVFMPDGGTAQDPKAGKLLTTLSFPARQIALDAAADVLFAVSADIDEGVAAFDISDPSEPFFLGHQAHAVALQEVRGLGLAGGDLRHRFPLRDRTSRFPEITPSIPAGALGRRRFAAAVDGQPRGLFGASTFPFSDPDCGSVSPSFATGRLQLTYDDFGAFLTSRYDIHGVNYPNPGSNARARGVRPGLDLPRQRSTQSLCRATASSSRAATEARAPTQIDTVDVDAGTGALNRRPCRCDLRRGHGKVRHGVAGGHHVGRHASND